MAKFLSIPIQGRSSLNYLQTSYNLRVSAPQLLRLFSSFFVVNVYQEYFEKVCECHPSFILSRRGKL